MTTPNARPIVIAMRQALTAPRRRFMVRPA
jgi:hypothetical protein